MADRTINKTFTLNAGESKNFDTPPIDNGKSWIARSIGIGDGAVGDGKSVEFTLSFGVVGDFEMLRKFYTNGASQEFKVNKQVEGDNVKFLRVNMKNSSIVQHEVSWWIVLSEK